MRNWLGDAVVLWLLALLAVLLFVGLYAMTWPAQAHDWFTGLHNEKGELCCGGIDCGAIPEEDVTPVPGGYQVHVPNFKGWPVIGFVPNYRAKPAKEGGEYHLCYWGGEIRCFFYPAPSY